MKLAPTQIDAFCIHQSFPRPKRGNGMKIKELIDRGLRGIIFDIDDSLYLERDYVRSGFLALNDLVYERYAVKGFGQHCWELFLNGVRGNTFNIALEQLQIKVDAEFVRKLITRYREHEPQISLLADAELCLKRAAKELKIGFLTDGPLASQRAKAKALGLEQYAAPIIFTAELDAPKPSPIGFKALELALNLRGDSLVYIADNPNKDFKGPKSLGWRTLRLRRPLSLHEHIPSQNDIDAECKELIWD